MSLDIRKLVELSSLGGSLLPDTDDAYDIGSASLEWRDLYIDGTAYIDTLNLGFTNNAIPYSFGGVLTTDVSRFNYNPGTDTLYSWILSTTALYVSGWTPGWCLYAGAGGQMVGENVYTYNATTDTLSVPNITITGSLDTAIADTQVVYSNSGVLAGDAGMTYNAGTDSLTLLGNLTVGGSATLGNAATDIHGMNAPAQDGQMMTETWESAKTSGSEYGVVQSVSYSGNVVAFGTVNRYGTYLDQNLSGAGQFGATLNEYGYFIDSTDTGTWNTGGGVATHTGLYVDANGVVTTGSGYYRRAIYGIARGAMANAQSKTGVTGIAEDAAVLNIGGYFSATGATTNYAIYIDEGFLAARLWNMSPWQGGAIIIRDNGFAPPPFAIQDTGGENYLEIDTTDAGGAMRFGNATNNPTYAFQGSGSITLNGSLIDTTAVSLNIGIKDHVGSPPAFSISAFDDTERYIGIETTDGDAQINFGNVATNPAYTFIGTGLTTFGGVVDIITATDPQLRLTHTDGVDETDFYTNSDGELEIMPTARTIYLGDGTAGDSTFGFYGSASVYTLIHDESEGTLNLSANDATNYIQFAADGSPSFVGTAGLPYGHLYLDEGALVVGVAAANTYYEVNDAASPSLTVGNLHNITFSDHYLDVGTYAGFYLVTWSISVQTATAFDEISGTIMVDGTADLSATNHATMASANKEVSISGTTIVDLTTNKQISLAVANHTAIRDIVLSHANLSIVQIGGT